MRSFPAFPVYLKRIEGFYTYNASLYDLEGDVLTEKQVDIRHLFSSGLLPEFYSIARSKIEGDFVVTIAGFIK